MVFEWEKQIPTIRANMTGAIKRAHINGWKEDKNKSGKSHFYFYPAISLIAVSNSFNFYQHLLNLFLLHPYRI